MWVKRANMFDVECVARGYLSGSGWKEYQQTGGRLRHFPAPGTARERCFARTNFHAGDEGANAATMKIFRSSAWFLSSAKTSPSNCAI